MPLGKTMRYAFIDEDDLTYPNCSSPRLQHQPFSFLQQEQKSEVKLQHEPEPEPKSKSQQQQQDQSPAIVQYQQKHPFINPPTVYVSDSQSQQNSNYNNTVLLWLCCTGWACTLVLFVVIVVLMFAIVFRRRDFIPFAPIIPQS